MVSTITAHFNRAVERHIEKQRYSRMAGRIVSAVDRYAAKKKPAPGQKELRWITIGGGEEEGGGTHVQIDGDGKIVAGPKGLADKGVTKLSDFGGERDGGATTAQRPKESGVTESEAASRKWKKNDDGTYTAPNGTVWKKAAAGGEESPVNGKQYAGGSLMPIHGQSKARIEKGDGTGDVVDMKPGSPDDRNGTEAKLSKPKRTFQDRTRDRMGDLVNVPEGHRAIEKILAGSPGKSRRLPDEALAYLGLTRKQARDLADIWEADGGSAYIPVEIVPPSTASSRHAPTDEWDIAAKFKEWKDGKAKAARAVDADMSKLDPEMMLTAAQVPPTKATESQGTSKQKEAEESAQQSVVGDAAKAAGKTSEPTRSGPKSFAEIGPDHTSPIVADMKSGDMNAASQKFDALMGQTKAKQFEAHMLRQKLQDEAGIKQKTRAERKAEARGEVATSDEAAKPVGSPDGGMPTANPAAGATDNSDPIVPKVGEIHEFPAIGNRGPMRLKVTSHANGNVGIGMADSNLTWVQIPEESFPQFVGDMQGKVRVAANSGDPHIDRISSGQAKLLGKGDDGLVFDTGDGKVTKVSTTTPFVPLNPFHKTPDEAKRRAIDQFNVAKTLHKAGVPGIPRMSVKEHDGRVFTTRENLTIPDRLNEKQFRQAVDSVRKMHNAGYSVNDEIQIGVGADGNVYHFDLGKAAKAEHPDDFKSDQSRLDRLAESHGLKKRFINPQTEWKSYQEMLARRTDADKRQEEKGKTGKLVGEFRRIVADDVGRLRDQLTEDAPHESDRIGREFDEMMGRVSAAPTAPAPAPSTPAAPKPTVPGAQSGLFDRGELATGQKSLFNVVRPAKGGKKPVAPDLLSSVTADVRAHLERKGTLSPADIAGTSIQAESLEGQKEMFSRVRDAVERGIARYRLVGGSRY